MLFGVITAPVIAVFIMSLAVFAIHEIGLMLI